MASWLAWSRAWYPEVRLGVLAGLILSLAFPPFCVDNSPGSTAFLGWHSLFTYPVGYISLSRLGLLWLLGLVIAACVQKSGELCSRQPEPEQMFFGSPEGPRPLVGAPLLALSVAVPTWLALCGALVGRRNILGLSDHLGDLGYSAFQLVVLSRLLAWITRDRTHLQFAYAILCAAALAWDLRVSGGPEKVVGGLVPLYLVLGYLLYRFDLRFAEQPAPRLPSPPATTPPAVATSAVQEISEEGSPVSQPELEPGPMNAEPALEVPEAEVTGELQAADQEPAPAASPGPVVTDDPYSKYRPKN